MTPGSALAGITVLEICNVAAGPFCGMLLADMGADVIKLENPDGGDTLRSWPPLSQGYSENFASLNRNKRSVTLNLKVSDALSLLSQVMVDIDNGPAQPLVPADGVFDQTSEKFEWTAAGKLAPGEHVATLAATDRRGNTSVTKLVFSIDN